MIQLGQVVGRGFFGLTLVCFSLSALLPQPGWAAATPMVAITQPDNGAVVGAEVWVDAVYQSVSGRPIVRLDFLVDDQVVRTYTLPTPKTQGEMSFSYTFQSPAGEAHKLSVRAVDSAGAIGLATISVLVKKVLAPPGLDETPPVVNIYYPRPGDRVSGTVEIKVDARDNVGVEWVFFYVDGRVKAMIKGAPPYIDRWDTTKTTDGEHVLQARAWDAAENEGCSTEVRVVVANREATALQAREPVTAEPGASLAAPARPEAAAPAADQPVAAAEARAGAPEPPGGAVIPVPAPVPVQGPPTPRGRAAEAPRADQAPRPAATAKPAVATSAARPPAVAALSQRPGSLAPRSESVAAVAAVARPARGLDTRAAAIPASRAEAPRQAVTEAPSRVAALPATASVALVGAATALAAVPARADTSPARLTVRAVAGTRIDTPVAPSVGRSVAGPTEGSPAAVTQLAALVPVSVSSPHSQVRSGVWRVSAAAKPTPPGARPTVAGGRAVSALPGETALVRRAPEVYLLAALPQAQRRVPNEVRGTTPGPRPETEGRVTVLPLALSRFRDVQVLFDGRLVPLRACPEVVKGIPMGPLREIFAQTDGILYWFPVEKRVRGISPSVTLDLRVGQREAKVNGEPYCLELAPYVKQGRTMVPLGFLADVLDLTITFDSERGQLIVKTGAP